MMALKLTQVAANHPDALGRFSFPLFSHADRESVCARPAASFLVMSLAPMDGLFDR